MPEKSKWTVDNVNQALQELPALIARQTEIVADKQHELNKLKHKVDLKKARLTTKYMYQKSVTSRERQAIIKVAVEAQEAAVIEEKNLLQREQNKLKNLTNEFEAVKRFAQLRIAEMRNLETSFQK